jgi:hypothetical protein
MIENIQQERSIKKLQIPIPKSQSKFNHQKKESVCYPLFEIIDEKIRVSSRASATNASRLSMLWLVGPASTNRRNKRLSFASLR